MHSFPERASHAVGTMCTGELQVYGDSTEWVQDPLGFNKLMHTGLSAFQGWLHTYCIGSYAICNFLA